MPRVKLGTAQYEDPAANLVPSKEIGRLIFFDVAIEIQPELLKSLSERPLKEFLEFLISLKRHTARHDLKKVVPDWPALINLAGSSTVQGEITSWCQRWCLLDEWCFNFAVNALRMWVANEYARVTCSISPLFADIRKELLWADVLSPRTGIAKQQKTARKNDKSHFKWLVLYQTTPNISMDAVAKKFNVHRATAQEGITQTAQILDLTLRKRARPGPHKST